MDVKPLLLVMGACLVLPLASANARAVTEPGVSQAGVGAFLERGARAAENYGRKESENKGSKGGSGFKDDRDDRDDRGGKGGKGGGHDNDDDDDYDGGHGRQESVLAEKLTSIEQSG